MIHSELFYDKYPYNLAKIVAQSGRIEALEFNDTDGEIKVKGVAGLSAVMDYAFAVWNFYDKESAIDRVIISRQAESLSSDKSADTPKLIIKDGRNIEKDLAKQLAGDSLNKIKNAKNVSDEVSIDFSGAPNFVQKVGDFVAPVAGEIIIVMRHGGDISDFFSGRISGEQFIKNTAVTIFSATFAGAAVSIAPIGGAILTFFQIYAMKVKGKELAKKILDRFIEDDSKKMLEIFERELVEKLSGNFLTPYETTILAEAINDDLNKDFLKDMFGAGKKHISASEDNEARAAFARAHIQGRLDDVFAQRCFVEMPSEKDWDDGFQRVSEYIKNGEDIFAKMETKRTEALNKMRAKLAEFKLKPYEIDKVTEAVNDMTKTQIATKRTFQHLADSERRFGEIQRQQMKVRADAKTALQEIYSQL